MTELTIGQMGFVWVSHGLEHVISLKPWFEKDHPMWEYHNYINGAPFTSWCAPGTICNIRHNKHGELHDLIIREEVYGKEVRFRLVYRYFEGKLTIGDIKDFKARFTFRKTPMVYNSRFDWWIDL